MEHVSESDYRPLESGWIVEYAVLLKKDGTEKVVPLKTVSDKRAYPISDHPASGWVVPDENGNTYKLDPKTRKLVPLRTVPDRNVAMKTYEGKIFSSSIKLLFFADFFFINLI